MKYNNFSKDQVSYNEKEQMSLLEKCIDGTINREESMKLIMLIHQLYFVFNGNEKDLQIPSISPRYFKSNNVGGERDNENNSIYYSQDLFLQGEFLGLPIESLGDLINTIGHENTHYKQNNLLNYMDSLSNEEKGKLDSYTRKIASSYKNIEYLNNMDIKEIYERFLAYDLIPNSYKDENEFYSRVEYAAYLDKTFEKDARKGGIDFVKQVFNYWEKSEYATLKIKQWLNMQKETIINKQIDNESYGQLFISMYLQPIRAITSSQIFDVAKEFEAITGEKNDEIDSTDLIKWWAYERQMIFVLENLSLEKRIELLKKAAFDGLRHFQNALVDSIKNDPDYYKYKNDIENEILDMLKTGIINSNNIDERLTDQAYMLNWLSILPIEKYAELIISLLKQDKLIYADKLIDDKFLPYSYYHTKISEYYQEIIFNEYVKCLERRSKYNGLNLENVKSEEINAQMLSVDMTSSLFDEVEKITHASDYKIHISATKYEKIYGKNQLKLERMRTLKEFYSQSNLNKEDYLKSLSQAKTQEEKEFIQKVIEKIKVGENELSYEQLCEMANRCCKENDIDTNLLICVYTDFLSRYYQWKEASERMKQIKSKLDTRMSKAIEKMKSEYDESEYKETILILKELNKKYETSLIDKIANNNSAYLILNCFLLSNRCYNKEIYGNKTYLLTKKQATLLAKLVNKVAKRRMQNEANKSQDEEKSSMSR